MSRSVKTTNDITQRFPLHSGKHILPRSRDSVIAHEQISNALPAREHLEILSLLTFDPKRSLWWSRKNPESGWGKKKGISRSDSAAEIHLQLLITRINMRGKKEWGRLLRFRPRSPNQVAVEYWDMTDVQYTFSLWAMVCNFMKGQSTGWSAWNRKSEERVQKQHHGYR